MFSTIIFILINSTLILALILALRILLRLSRKPIETPLERARVIMCFVAIFILVPAALAAFVILCAVSLSAGMEAGDAIFRLMF